MDQFENLRRIQEAARKAISSQFHVSSDIRALQLRMAESLEPVMRAAAMLKIERAKMGLEFSQAAKLHLDQMQPILNQLSQAAALKVEIPKNVFPRLEELSSTLKDVLPDDDESELSSNVTAEKPDVPIAEQSWTWETLSNYLTWVFQILTLLITLSTHQESSIQSERHHQELMIEERKQTELLMEIRDIDREALEYSKEIAESILRDIEILIPDDQGAPESDDEPHQ